MFHVKQFLRNEFSHAGHVFSDLQIHQFQIYCDEILKWNRRVRLTGAKTEKDLPCHLLISLAYLNHMGSPSSSRVLDLGSGVGFPGIPLKISRPDIKIDLVDSVSKKISFLKNICRKLNLEDTRCFLTRFENLKKTASLEFPYDFIVSRAVTDLETIIDASFDFLRPGGKWIVLKGKSAPLETGHVLKNYPEKISLKTFTIPDKEWGKDLLFVVMEKC